MPRGDRFARRRESAGKSPFTGDPTCSPPLSPLVSGAAATSVAETAPRRIARRTVREWRLIQGHEVALARAASLETDPFRDKETPKTPL
jgi:hypothetical protein